VSLTIAVPEPARVHWGTDGWQNVSDRDTEETGLGLHVITIDAAALAKVRQIDFTFECRTAQNWAGTDFHVGLQR
jgi:glucoamylase